MILVILKVEFDIQFDKVFRLIV